MNVHLEREVTLAVLTLYLIGLHMNVFQIAPGAYRRMEPSRGMAMREKQI